MRPPRLNSHGESPWEFVMVAIGAAVALAIIFGKL
jgi:hypothetical protein